MLITGIDSTVSSETGQALDFTIMLEEVIIKKTEIIKLAPVELDDDVKTKASDTDGGKKQSLEPKTTILKDIV